MKPVWSSLCSDEFLVNQKVHADVASGAAWFFGSLANVMHQGFEGDSQGSMGFMRLQLAGETSVLAVAVTTLFKLMTPESQQGIEAMPREKRAEKFAEHMGTFGDWPKPVQDKVKEMHDQGCSIVHGTLKPMTAFVVPPGWVVGTLNGGDKAYGLRTYFSPLKHVAMVENLKKLGVD